MGPGTAAEGFSEINLSTAKSLLPQLKSVHPVSVRSKTSDVISAAVLNTDKNGIAIRVAHCGGGPNKAAPIEGLDFRGEDDWEIRLDRHTTGEHSLSETQC